MDYANLGYEYDSISKYCKQRLETIMNLQNYYLSVYQYGELFYTCTKKENNFFSEEEAKFAQTVQGRNNKTTLSAKLSEFSKGYDDFSNRMKIILSKLSKDVIDPIEICQQNLSLISNEMLEEFNITANLVYDTKKNLEKVKMKYYESCIYVQEQEKNMCKTFSGSYLKNDLDIAKAHDNLLRVRSQSENYAQLYRYEISKANKLFEEYDKKYQLVVDRFRTSEESRIFFMKSNMEKFTKLWDEFSMIVTEFTNKLHLIYEEIQMDEDMRIFDDQFRYSLFGVRVPREEFVSYDLYKKQFESTTNQSTVGESDKEAMEKEKENVSLMSLNPTENATLGNINEDFEIIEDSQFFSEKYQITFINSFLKQLLSEREIEVDDMGKLIELISNNPFFAKTFIDCILKDRRNHFIQLKNLSNLQHLANIFSTITLDLENINSDDYDLNFAVIFISERTFFKSENQQVYLCSLLSKNKLFSTRTYWTDLIELKLARRLEEHINQLAKMDSNVQFKQGKDNTVRLSPKDKDISVLFSSIGSKIKNMFNKDKEKKVEDSATLLGSTRTAKLIKNYDGLAENKKMILDKITTSEIYAICKEFIPHLSNFNFDMSEAIDMLVELATKYKLSKEKISYFVTYLNSSEYSIRKHLPGRLVSSFLQKNITNIKEKRASLIQNINPISSSIALSSNEEKMLVLGNLVKYLPQKEYLDILTLNKTFHKKMVKKIYKHVLMKEDVDMKVRLGIWKKLLQINQLVKTVNYKEIKAFLEKKTKENKPLHSFQEIIDLDVMRTYFESNIEQGRKAIAWILKSIAEVNPEINYCQGMNYIASFLYQISENEEETFYIMLGLLENTEFSLIFMEDLHKLKIFFYVFERLLSLYAPELFSCFKANSVVVNYFCSPWFLTLFTTACPYVVNNEHPHPRIILKIWDDFFLHGWKSLMIAGMCLLKSYESTLVDLKYEDLLHFVINDLIKLGFFQNSNYKNFVNMANSIKIKTNLINNLENEQFQENKIREAEERDKLGITLGK